MYAFVEGELAQLEPTAAVVACHGVGYYIRIPLSTYEALQGLTRVRLLTHLHITDTAHTLYGFAHAEEKAAFEQLLGISGVGGGTALTILSSLSPTELRQTVEREDVARLKRVKGIGAKTAGRIVLELKGKLPTGAGDTPTVGSMYEEALQALLSLGFTKAAMEKKLDALFAAAEPPATVEAAVKAALRG